MDTKPSGTNETAPIDRYLTPIAVLVGAIIIGGALYFGHGTTPGTQQQQAGNQQQQPSVNIADVKTAGEPYVGKEDAPVTIAVWLDYQCPVCKMFDESTLAQVYASYVQTGKVKIVYKTLAFLGPDSKTDAMFGYAVWDLYPDKFYTWLQAMFEKQDKENEGFGDLASVEALTKTIPGIDVDKVVARMNEKKSEYEAKLAANGQDGVKFGIQGTPSTIVDNQLLMGVIPFDQLSALLDTQLQGK
ncbi:MAG TPA: thioredoxin domain-containing protein [Candidatus Paceibacterota bacterium]